MTDKNELLLKVLPVLDSAVERGALTRDEAFSVLDLFGPERFAADLDAIDAGDPDRAHGQADDLLLQAVNPEVRAAYERLVARASWWATA